METSAGLADIPVQRAGMTSGLLPFFSSVCVGHETASSSFCFCLRVLTAAVSGRLS